MENPFHRRAAEFLRDDEAFLAIVSPDPVTYFLGPAGRAGTLYDRLVLLRGTPGTAKRRWPDSLSSLQFIRSSAIRVLPATRNSRPRFPSAGLFTTTIRKCLAAVCHWRTDYRDFWEASYAEELKANLMTTLLQAARSSRGSGTCAERASMRRRWNFRLVRNHTRYLILSVGVVESKCVPVLRRSKMQSIT